MISKLKSFEAKIKGNEQESFSGNYGVMYVFTVYFEDGTEGEANSTKQQPSWNIGKEYEYTKDVKTFDWGTVTKIKMKQVKEEGSYGNKPAASKGGGYKMTPEKQKMIMCQVALIATNSIMHKMQEDHSVIVRHFLSYLIKEGAKHDPISLQGALKIAAEYYQQIQVANVEIQEVLDKTTEFMEMTEKSSKWSGEIPTVGDGKVNMKELDKDPKEDNAEPVDPFMKIV